MSERLLDVAADRMDAMKTLLQFNVHSVFEKNCSETMFCSGFFFSPLIFIILLL